jgi:HSP20 family protein
VADWQVEPFVRELRAMKERMDALYSESCGGVGEKEAVATTEKEWHPEVDVLETPEEWLFVADLPGVLEEDLNVEVEDDRLIISGRKPPHALSPLATNGIVRTLRGERSYGHFNRALPVPREARQDEIQAELKNGVLTVTVPKQHTLHAPQHKITVQSR